jgi:hypothetical protein
MVFDADVQLWKLIIEELLEQLEGNCITFFMQPVS